MEARNRKNRGVLNTAQFTFVFLLIICATLRAQYLTVYGGPTYDTSTGNGLTDLGALTSHHVAAGGGSGFQATTERKDVAGATAGNRAVRWDTSGFIELGNLGTTNAGSTDTHAFAVNNAGTVVGYASKYVSDDNKGHRGVSWNSAGIITELGLLGTDNNGVSTAQATTINNVGTIAGFAEKYDAGVDKGRRAVRWDSSGTAIELDNLGTDNNGVIAGAGVNAINDSGIVVGFLDKYVDGANAGARAVRWDTAGAVTELSNLGIDTQGNGGATVLKLNAAGTAVGYSTKIEGGEPKGFRAVRWDASGTAATELDNLGTDSNGQTTSEALAINSGGTAVGYAFEYNGDFAIRNTAARWDASGTAVTKLGNLGTDPSGFTFVEATAVNDAGIAVGFAWRNGNQSDVRAVMWGQDTVAIDLNSLIDPASGWVLGRADCITNDNWISGIGSFDPDGPGPLPSYTRPFLIQLPEPSLALPSFALIIGLWRRRQSRRQSGF